MKLLALALVSIAGIYFGIFLSAKSIAAQDRPAFTPNYRIGVIRLVTDEGDTFCTGTVVNATTIITAAHCVIRKVELNIDQIEIRASDNIPLKLYGKPEVVSVPEQLDTAILTGDFKQFTPKRYITNPRKLTKIRKNYESYLIACGYPMRGDLYCSRLEGISPSGFQWASRGVLLPGMSGGPTMLEDGTQVAVNTAVSYEYSLVSPLYNVLRQANSDDYKNGDE